VKNLEEKMVEYGVGKVASIIGRYYAMDRDKRWDRVEKAYNAIVYGEGLCSGSAQGAIDASYSKEVTDEFVEPTLVTGSDGIPVGTVSDGDSVFFFNFRQDRARELTRAFMDDEFDGFNRKTGKLKIAYATMTQYDATFTVPYAYPPIELVNILAQVLADNGKTEIRLAETEKYAHVTFFFNGGVEEPYKGEDRRLIPSPKVATYDLKPEMSAYEVADAAVESISSGNYDCIIMNFANGDMVGHTGVEEAAVKACTAVDECLGKVVSAVRDLGGSVVITADHGNSECMVDDKTGEPYTAHTLNPVPCIIISDYPVKSLRSGGVLGDIAPTLLELLGVPQPKEMTGKTLIEK
jgi:2,3-bisphosphoglycerate-independent phosphoglycerate mutase